MSRRRSSRSCREAHAVAPEFTWPRSRVERLDLKEAHVAKKLTFGAAVAATLMAKRSRSAAFVAGATLLASSALTRYAIFEAGVASAEDPKFTVVPQRERLQREISAERP